MNSQPQNCAIDRSDSLEFPIRLGRGLRDQLIQAGNVSYRSFEQRIRKLPRRIGSFRAPPELCFQFLRVLWAHLRLKQHLHRTFACLRSESHATTAALSFSTRRSLPRCCAASSKLVPSQSPPIPPQILCCRSSILRGLSPAPACPPSARKKSPARPCPSAPVAARAKSPRKHNRSAPSLRESRTQSLSARHTSPSAPASCMSAAIRTSPAGAPRQRLFQSRQRVPRHPVPPQTA